MTTRYVQPPLQPFADLLPPFQRHSATSRAAAIAYLPKTGTKRRIVFDFIQRCGSYGATDNEGIEATGQVQGYRARRGELIDDGFVEKAGFTRKTRAGLEADVYVAKEQA